MTAPSRRGIACRVCGGTLRYVSTGRCVACHQRNGRNEHARRRERENEQARLKVALVEYAESERMRVKWVFDLGRV